MAIWGFSPQTISPALTRVNSASPSDRSDQSAGLQFGGLMPWTPAQHHLFEAAAHNPAVAKKVGIPQDKAAQMAAEGIKRKKLAKALKG